MITLKLMIVVVIHVIMERVVLCMGTNQTLEVVCAVYVRCSIVRGGDHTSLGEEAWLDVMIYIHSMSSINNT